MKQQGYLSFEVLTAVKMSTCLLGCDTVWFCRQPLTFWREMEVITCLKNLCNCLLDHMILQARRPPPAIGMSTDMEYHVNIIVICIEIESFCQFKMFTFLRYQNKFRFKHYLLSLFILLKNTQQRQAVQLTDICFVHIADEVSCFFGQLLVCFPFL